MIYIPVKNVDPIRQGDIFRRIPRVDFSLSKIPVISEDSQCRLASWRDILDASGDKANITAVLPVTAVEAIVITQNCDAGRGEYLCLCQIVSFSTAINQQTPPKSPGKWASLITQHSKTNLRLFYLPEDPAYGFKARMAVDFRTILRIPRFELEDMRDLRVARLNTDSTEHFRETLAQFFRRYPYNEWYPLTKEEFHAYASKSPEPVVPYPWQE